MSKGLEALCYLDDIAHGRKMKLDAHELKLIIEKELNALEIIKTKCVDIRWVVGNNPFIEPNYFLTQEEYEILKEVLELH